MRGQFSRRLEEEDTAEREAGLPSAERSRQVARTTGQFLFALVAPQTDCEVLEIGGSRGYSTIWLGAGVRYLGGRVLSLEHDPAKCEAWRRNIAEAGLEETCELVEGDAFETLREIDDVFDVVFLDAEKDQYEELFSLAREKLEPAAIVVADNVLSHADPLGRLLARPASGPDARVGDGSARPRARGQRPPSLEWGLTAERRWSDLTDSSTGSGGTSG